MNGNSTIVKVVTSEQMREIDRIAIEEIGIPASVLMNNAGRAVARFVKENFNYEKVTILCGTGNNGGDGFTAAYYLINSGFNISLYLAGEKNKISETSRTFMNICENSGIKLHVINKESISSIDFPEDGLIIDAILGTGFEGASRGIPEELIKTVNDTNCKIISVDIPSGMNSNGYLPAGEFIKADYTITIGLPKISLVTYPCKEYCGKVIIEDIGFPSFLTKSNNIKTVLINNSFLRSFRIFNDRPDTHKGERGHTLIIGGFNGMEGAALLTASAMLNTGCGLLTILTTSESRTIIAGKLHEVMTLSLPDDPFSNEFKTIIESGNFKTAVIGPGLGRTIYSEKIFKNFIEYAVSGKIKKILIDGDGLFHLAEYLKNNRLPDGIEFVITPHFLEASRILNKSVSELKSNRYLSSLDLSSFTGCITVLKGPSTIVSNVDESFINTTGNSGLATAGSGDVLSGIIGSLMNIDIPAVVAAAAGVYIHGLAADIFSLKFTQMSMRATDIIDNIKPALKTGFSIYE